MARAHRLTEVQRIPTSGARAVEAFTIDGTHYLAIPQLSYDQKSSPGGMNGGNSNTDVLLLKWDGTRYVEDSVLPGVGGEDAEFFTIDDRKFLAIASIRMGSGPYNFEVGSPIYEWKDGTFEPFQTVLGYAAKEWRHFTIDGVHYLGLAQNRPGPKSVSSVILRWNGERFEEFQEIPSRGGYNLYAFEIDGTTYLAHADHSLPSKLYRWENGSFVEHQDLAEAGARAFLRLEDADGIYLAIASMHADSLLLKWDGAQFAPHQVLEGGTAGREFQLVEAGGSTFVVRPSFVRGPLTGPTTTLESPIYRFVDGRLELDDEFDTTGACDATLVHSEDGEPVVAVTNALSADVTFASETVLYRFSAAS